MNVAIAENNSLTRYSLITFGSKTCPFCKALHDFFDSNYKDKYYFFWIEDRRWFNLLFNLSMIEIRYGLSEEFAGKVPHTMVLVNGSPVAVVIGEVADTEFWDRLISSNVTDVVVVYLGETRSGIEIPVSSLTSFLSELESALTQPDQPQQSINLAGLTLIIIGVALLIFYLIYLVKRRAS